MAEAAIEYREKHLHTKNDFLKMFLKEISYFNLNL